KSTSQGYAPNASSAPGPVNPRRPNMRLMKRLDNDLSARKSELDLLDFHGGRWIKTVRAATGTTHVALGRKLRISQPAVTKLETAEETGRITIAKLEEVAAALDCTVVYGLVPRKSFQAIARARGVDV